MTTTDADARIGSESSSQDICNHSRARFRLDYAVPIPQPGLCEREDRARHLTPTTVRTGDCDGLEPQVV